MNKPGPISAKPLSVLLGDVFTDAYAKQGFASRELVTRWAEIAGTEVAAHAEPLQDAVAAAGRGPAAGTGDADAAGRGAGGAGNPAQIRRHPRTGQPLLRLERGRTAGAAPGAAVAPRKPASPQRAPDAEAVDDGRRRPCPPSTTTSCARRWRGWGPPSSEIESAGACWPVATRHCHNCRFKLAKASYSAFAQACTRHP